MIEMEGSLPLLPYSQYSHDWKQATFDFHGYVDWAEGREPAAERPEREAVGNSLQYVNVIIGSSTKGSRVHTAGAYLQKVPPMQGVNFSANELMAETKRLEAEGQSFEEAFHNAQEMIVAKAECKGEILLHRGGLIPLVATSINEVGGYLLSIESVDVVLQIFLESIERDKVHELHDLVLSSLNNGQSPVTVADALASRAAEMGIRTTRISN